MISKTHDDTPILSTAFQLSTNDRNPVESLPSSLESAGLIGRAAPSCQGNCPVGSNASKLRLCFLSKGSMAQLGSTVTVFVPSTDVD